MASLAVGGGVYNDSTICFIIKLSGGFKSPVISRRAFLRCGGLFELAEIDPIAGRNFIFLSFALLRLS
jgi:hypothetical protein